MEILSEHREREGEAPIRLRRMEGATQAPINERRVMNMKGFYPLIAFGMISFYIAVGLVIFTYAITIRLLPAKVKIPVVGRSLEKIRVWLR